MIVTISEIGGQPKKQQANPSYKVKQQNTSKALL